MLRLLTNETWNSAQVEGMGEEVAQGDRVSNWQLIAGGMGGLLLQCGGAR